MLLKLNENSRDMSSCPSPGCTCVDVIAAAVPLWAEFCRRGGALSRPSVAPNGGEPHTWQHCGSTVALLRVPWLVLGAAGHAPTAHRGGGGICGILGRHVPPARASVRHRRSRAASRVNGNPCGKFSNSAHWPPTRDCVARATVPLLTHSKRKYYSRVHVLVPRSRSFRDRVPYI